MTESDLKSRLDLIYETIDVACTKSGSHPESVTIVAVTKTFPREYISNAYALGIRHFGENRVQEIIEKFEDGGIGHTCPEIVLHLVGHLQTNKAKKAVQFATSIDSVDSLRVADAINQDARERNRRIRALLEVNTSGEPQKFGIQSVESVDVAEAVLKHDHLDLAGLMTIGPNKSDETSIRRSFSELRDCYEKIKKELNPPCWSVLSMGMSGDYPIAIEEGATEIRLGTALFGARSNP